MEKRKSGFALMTPERRKEVARKGGQRAQELGTGHRWNEVDAAEAGRKGGRAGRGDVKRHDKTAGGL